MPVLRRWLSNSLSMLTLHTTLKLIVGHILAGAVVILGTLLVTLACYIIGLATALGWKLLAKSGVHTRTMKKAITFAFAISILLLAGCGTPSPVTMNGTPVHVTDLGVVEVLPDTPKNLKIDGQNCTLTASPYPGGKLQIFVESKQTNTERNTGVRTNKSWTASTVVPSGVEFTGYIGQKLVRLTLKLKES